MKPRKFLAGCALLAILATSGCFDNDDDAMTPPANGSTTARVEMLASNASESDEPFEINDGAFEFNDTRDETDAAMLP